MPLGAHREERLQQRRPQQHLRRDRGPPRAGVERLEASAQRSQRLIRQRPDRPQRMIRRNTLLEPHVAEKPLRAIFPSAHPATPAYPTAPVNHLQKLDASDFFSSLLEVEARAAAGEAAAGDEPLRPRPPGSRRARGLSQRTDPPGCGTSDGAPGARGAASGAGSAGDQRRGRRRRQQGLLPRRRRGLGDALRLPRRLRRLEAVGATCGGVAGTGG